VTTRDELDALSSHELHNLAVRRALEHADVEFLWELLRALPAAEAVEGHPAHAGADISKVSSLIADAIDSGQGDLAEALRPLYLDYLEKHGTGRSKLAGRNTAGRSVKIGTERAGRLARPVSRYAPAAHRGHRQDGNYSPWLRTASTSRLIVALSLRTMPVPAPGIGPL
jgi:hypothetical protein